jgi:hypothetical protein
LDVEASGSGAQVQVVIRVSLLGSDPVIWRQLSMAGDLTLDRVHEVLQAALGWEDAHLHRFTAKDPYARITPDELDQGWPPQWLPAEFVEEEYDRPEDQTTLAELVGAGGGSAYYEYDFGDSWLHLLEVLEHAPDESGPVRLIAGGNACPPEDCGGIHAYLDSLDALADPAHPAHLPAVQTTQGPIGAFDPRAFDRVAAEAALARAQHRWNRHP